MNTKNLTIENITNEELERLKNYKNKMVKKVLSLPIISFVIFGAIFIIPMKYIPIKKRHFGEFDYDLSIMQNIGIPMTLAIVGGLSVLFLIMAYFYYKPAKLSKDIKEGKKVTLQVSITDIVKPSPMLEQIDVSFTPAYKGIKKIHFIEKTNLSTFYEGLPVKIIVSKNALYPFEIMANK